MKHFRKVTTNAIRITITETIEDFTPEWLNIKVFDAQEELFKFAEINDLRNRPDYRKLDDIVIEGLKAEWHLAEKTVIKGIIFTPENTASGGMPLNYELAVYSSDGEWNIISQGEFANIQSNPVPQVVTFKPVEAAALRLTARRCVDPDAKTPDIHEFGILI